MNAESAFIDEIFRGNVLHGEDYQLITFERKDISQNGVQI